MWNDIVILFNNLSFSNFYTNIHIFWKIPPEFTNDGTKLLFYIFLIISLLVCILNIYSFFIYLYYYRLLLGSYFIQWFVIFIICSCTQLVPDLARRKRPFSWSLWSFVMFLLFFFLMLLFFSIRCSRLFSLSLLWNQLFLQRNLVEGWHLET